MIDVNKKVRESIMTALDETITYDDVIPCYHEINPNENETLYIILNTQTEEDNSNKSAFVTTGTILIDVVHNSGQNVTYDVVDTVAGEIMEILQPTVKTHGLTNPTGLTIVNVRRLSSTYLTINDSSGNVMRRLLRYEYEVQQN